jgi:4-amino-4-deoxy-L-arabinose transferase-like glycosyltransferase
MTTDTPSRPGWFALRSTAALAVLVASWLGLQVWGLGKSPFHTKGEPREAVVVSDILQRGRWVLPLRNASELPAKPPLFHWLGAAASLALGGVSELSVRLPSAILSGAATLMLFACTAILCGPLAAMLASLGLLTSFEWLRAATSARVDMALAFGLTLAFCGMMMRRISNRSGWLIVAHLGMAVAALAKGPVGIALPLLQVALLCAVDRSLAFARAMRLARGVAIALSILTLWYGLAFLQGGRQFLAKQVLDENLYRFLGSAKLSGGHRHSIGYLAGALLLGLLPWTILLPPAAADLWQRRTALGRRDPRLFALLWSLLVFAFYGQAASKRGVYLLPLYPALFLLFGCWASELIAGRTAGDRIGGGIAAAVGWILAAAMGIAAIAIGLTALPFPVASALSSLLDTRAAAETSAMFAALAHQPIALVAFAIAAAAALVFAVAAPAGRWGVALSGLFGVTAAASVAVRQSILPEIASAQSRARFVDAVRARPIDVDNLAAFRHFDYGFVYYWRRPVAVAADLSLTASAPRYLVVAESEWNRVDAGRRADYEPIPALGSNRTDHRARLIVVQRVGGEELAGKGAEP